MKKIKMIVTNRYDPDVRVHKEAKYLISRGFDVEILCWDRENEYINKLDEHIDGVKIRRFFPYSKYGSGLRQIKPYIKFIFELKNYLRKVEYKYLHCHDLDGVIAGYLVNDNKAKLIFDMHEFYEGIRGNNKKSLLIKLIVLFFQNKSNWIVYINDIQIDKISKKNKRKLVYLPNYPDLNDYKLNEKKSDEKLRISYIGSVRQYNELKNLIDACKEIENVVVAIHGMGVAYEKLKSISHNYNNLLLTGVFDITQSSELYNTTDVLYAVYPMDSVQNKKSYPVKFYEAIITKTPIIVNKGSILEEFLYDNDIGFVVNGEDINEIRDLIVSISQNREILDKKRGNIDKIQYQYNWQQVIKNIDQIYE